MVLLAVMDATVFHDFCGMTVWAVRHLRHTFCLLLLYYLYTFRTTDGELFVTISHHFRHQQAAGQIQVALVMWSEKSGFGRALQALGVIFSPKNVVIPDLVLVTHQRIKIGINESGHFTVAPN